MSAWFLQTFQKVDESQGQTYETVADEKSPLMEPFAQSSVYKRKSSRGASFASEGKTEKKEKLKDNEEKEEGVSWN